jgi:hypothetical protein
MTVVTRDVSAAHATPLCPALTNEAGDSSCPDRPVFGQSRTVSWASTVPFHP